MRHFNKGRGVGFSPIQNLGILGCAEVSALSAVKTWVTRSAARKDLQMQKRSPGSRYRMELIPNVTCGARCRFLAPGILAEFGVGAATTLTTRDPGPFGKPLRL